MASGKGTAVQYLKEKHGASTYRFSAMLKDVLERLYLDLNRKNYQTISQILRENFGEDTLAKVMARDAENDPAELIAIDGVRRPGDVVHLKNIPGFVLVHLTADIEKRFERMTKRGEKADDSTKTLEQFKQEHHNEAELKIEEIAKEAQETIDNNGTLKKLYEQLDKVVEKFKANSIL